MNHFLFSLTVATLLLSVASFCHAERQGIVIGNRDYSNTGRFPDLATSVNDAALMHRLMVQAGFKMAPEVKDATRLGMEDALTQFCEGLQAGDEAVVYYAGHGIQFENKVYLMGTNAEFRIKGKLSEEGVSQETLAAMLGERGIKLAVLILDCCREVPDQSWLASEMKSRGMRGSELPALVPPPNILIGYATSSGRLTNDLLLETDANGPLVMALQKHWNEGLEFDPLWKAVARDVFTASRSVEQGTAELQMPSKYGQTVHDFYFINLPKVSEKMKPASGEDIEPKTKPSKWARVTKDRPFVNSLGMRFVPVPVYVGEQVSSVVLFSIWETRRKDFEAFAESNPAIGTEWRNAFVGPFPVGHEPMHPVSLVSHEDAESFCLWLTDRERSLGLLSANEKYRLPSDHEWSCAIGIGQLEDSKLSPRDKDRKLPGMFPWGSAFPPPNGCGNYAGKEHRSHLGDREIPDFNDGFVTTAPVGSFEANPLGLFDLGGNAFEWCGGYYTPSGQKRFARGGAWFSQTPEYLQSSDRVVYEGVEFMNTFYGFRAVLEVSGD